ncbi:hypothetical protein, partial [Hydrogenimonas sp.]|uniref:hypothetical protein n=1 Tax=Hydrogenimonas sp. TaxID=2231112 RepID=UPI00261D6338
NMVSLLLDIEPISKIPIGGNGSDFASSCGASTQAMPSAHRQGEATKRGGKSAPPAGWHKKARCTSLKMLDVALATPCAFRLVIAPFGCHFRPWGFLRWVLVSFH